MMHQSLVFLKQTVAKKTKKQLRTELFFKVSLLLSRVYLEALANKEGNTQEQLWAKITTWYNGYSWGGMGKVYNPFSIAMLFNKMRFDEYWVSQGTPAWLLRLLKPEDLKGTQTFSSPLSLFPLPSLFPSDVWFIVFSW